MKVRDAMTTEPACCTPETSLEAAARMMIESDCGSLPVVDDLVNKIPIGLVTDRDIVTRAIAVGKNPLDLTVRDCMTAPAITVMSGMSLGECVEILEVTRVHGDADHLVVRRARLLAADCSARFASVVGRSAVTTTPVVLLAEDCVGVTERVVSHELVFFHTAT